MPEVTNQELQEHLMDHLAFIESSAISFDNGFENEIKRLAVSIRVLVHDTSQSTSLMALLEQKNIKYVDTSMPYPENSKISHSGLVQVSLSASGRASKPLPLLDDGPFSRMVSFELWWNGIIFVDKDGNEFSRKDIVLSLANKDGGAHVDKKLDQKYINLRKNNSLGCFDGTADGKETPAAEQVPATMRQIAHEMLKTLKPNYECHREKTADDGLFFMGASLVVGNSLPSISEHNLPKNRPVIEGKKIGRNNLCLCGSGKKYKKCCLK